MAGAALLLAVTGCGAARAADPDTGIDLRKLGRAGDFSLAPPDVSEDAPTGWYVRADAGWAGVAGGDLAYAGVPLGMGLSGSGWSVGGGLGYRVTNFLRAEVGIDYLSLGSVETGFGRMTSSATVALASVYWDMVTLAGFTPYLSAGAGFAIDDLAAPAALAPSGNSWGFAWSVGAGVSYALSSRVSLDVGYRYAALGSPGSADGLSVSDMAAHQVRFGVRYMLQ